MFKPPWRELVEQTILFGAITARLEFGLAKNYPTVKPTYAQFKERIILRSVEAIKGKEPFLKQEFEPFKSYFNQCMLALKQNEDASLERIIKKKFDEL